MTSLDKMNFTLIRYSFLMTSHTFLKVIKCYTISWTTRHFYRPPKQCIWRLSCTRFRTTRVNNHEQNRVIMGSEKRLLTYLICATWAVLRQCNCATLSPNEILSKEWQKPGHVIIFSQKWGFWAVQAGWEREKKNKV